MDAEPGRPRRIVRGAFRALDLTRRIVWNGVFLLVVLLLLAALLGGGTKVPKDAVLVLDPQGDLVEQLTGGPAERARARLAGSEARETLLKDMLDALRRAKDDKRIKVLLIDTDGLGGASLTKLQDLRAAIDDFRKSGKKVVAAGDGFDQTQYYLASCADEIHMHDQGILLLEGYGRFATFYKEGIDKLEVGLERLPRRRVQVRGRAVPAQRHVAEAKEANRDYLERPVGAAGCRTWRRRASRQPRTLRGVDRQHGRAAARGLGTGGGGRAEGRAGGPHRRARRPWRSAWSSSRARRRTRTPIRASASAST